MPSFQTSHHPINLLANNVSGMSHALLGVGIVKHSLFRLEIFLCLTTPVFYRAFSYHKISKNFIIHTFEMSAKQQQPEAKIIAWQPGVCLFVPRNGRRRCLPRILAISVFIRLLIFPDNLAFRRSASLVAWHHSFKRESVHGISLLDFSSRISFQNVYKFLWSLAPNCFRRIFSKVQTRDLFGHKAVPKIACFSADEHFHRLFCVWHDGFFVAKARLNVHLWRGWFVRFFALLANGF